MTKEDDKYVYGMTCGMTCYASDFEPGLGNYDKPAALEIGQKRARQERPDCTCVPDGVWELLTRCRLSDPLLRSVASGILHSLALRTCLENPDAVGSSIISCLFGDVYRTIDDERDSENEGDLTEVEIPNVELITTVTQDRLSRSRARSRIALCSVK